MDFNGNSVSGPAFNWRVLGLLNLYRVLVPLVLLSLYYVGGPRGIMVVDPRSFFGALAAYFSFGVASVVMVRRRLAPIRVQTILQGGVDIGALMLSLIHI